MRLPSFSGKELINVLRGIGFRVVAQKGSHSKLTKGNVSVIIPDEDQLAQKTLLSIIDQANLSSEEILSLMGSGGSEAPVSTPMNEEEYEVSAGSSLSIFRIIIGVLFIILAIDSGPWGNYGLFNLYLKHALENPTGLYVPVLSMMQSAPGFFGWLFFFGALLVGLALVFGAFVPLFSLIGIIWVLNQALMLMNVKTEWLWTYVMWVMALVVFWTLKSGRVWGLDKKFARKFEPKRGVNTFWNFMNKIV